MKHTIKQVKLKNGLKGLVLHVPDASVVSFEVSFRAGEFLLDAKKWETAHIMEHLMLGANRQYKTARSFQAELEKNGAYSNASTNAYDVTYELECASFESGRVLELLIGALSSPIFKQKEFKAEYGNVAEELVSRSNNHFRTLNLALRSTLGFYCLPDQERIDLMQNVSLSDIKAHYLKTHSVLNARFVLAGNITDQHLNILSGLEFASSSSRIDLPDETPIVLKKPVIISRKDVPNLYFYIDTYAPRLLTLSENDALSVVSTLLTETLHSKLLGAAREQGLVYAMGSGQQQLKEYSSFWLGAQVSKKNVNKLFDLMYDVIRTMKLEGVTLDELDAAKQYMKGRHTRSSQTITGLLGNYSHDYYHSGLVLDEATYVERIQAVTVEDICYVLQLLCSGTWALGLLGDIDDELANALHVKTARVLN